MSDTAKLAELLAAASNDPDIVSLPQPEWTPTASFSTPTPRGGRTRKGPNGLGSVSPEGGESLSSHAPPTLISAEHAAAMLSASISTWWRLHSAARTPQAIKIGNGLTRWRRTDVEQFITLAFELGRWPKRSEFESFVTSR